MLKNCIHFSTLMHTTVNGGKFEFAFSVKAWQDIWARTFSEVPLRVTLEYLIQSELDWLNQDFKHLISNQARVTL